jgi:hypothetical protein
MAIIMAGITVEAIITVGGEAGIAVGGTSANSLLRKDGIRSGKGKVLNRTVPPFAARSRQLIGCKCRAARAAALA